MDFLDNLDPLLRTFWYVAIPASVMFLIQTILTFIGSDSTDGLEADFDGDLDDGHGPFQLFSLRNLVNFLLGFGWTGISFYQLMDSKPLLIGLSLLIGVAFVYVFFLVIRQIQKLAEDNSFRITSTLAKTAEVYIPIPGHKEGRGKVLISINGAVHELDAISESERIASNTLVKVVKVSNNQVLVVEPL